MAKVTVDDIAAEAGVLAGHPLPPVPRRQGRPVRGPAPAASTRTSSPGSTAHLGRRRLARGPRWSARSVAATRAAPRRRAPPADAGRRARRDVHDLTVDGLPVIIASATAFLGPWFAPLHRRGAPAELVELLARLVISYFLAPSPLRRPRRPGVGPRFIRQLRPAGLRPVHHPATPGRTDPLTAPMTPATEEILGRADINDIEAILAIANTDVDEIEHVVKNNADAIFTWDYSLARPALRKLYEKAKTGQWNATTDLPWDTDVDLEKTVVEADQAAIGTGIDPTIYVGTPVEKWGDKEWLEFGIEGRRWTPQPVHARRAGRAALHGEDRRDRAVVRRQALRLHPGGRRGPPRRGVRPLPRREARRRSTRSTPTCGCCSTTSSTTAAGT